jgi:NAD(P)-dependent dehydrogenase (short-subunit alcohol dehydrogenase family)
MRFSDRVVLLTGIGDGQGRVAALRLAEEGAKIVGADINEETATETARLVTEAGGEIVCLAPLDLTAESGVEELIEAGISKFGRIDAVYNNAAGARLGSAMESSVEDFAFTLTGVVQLTWLVTKLAVPHLEKADSPAVLNIASVAGLVGSGMVMNAPYLAAYSTAKAAVLRLTNVLAIELAPRRIRVNVISPGMIDTPAVAPILGSERLRGWHEDHLLVDRIGKPEDIVNAALFLLSDEAAYITGQNLVVDGGWTASGGGFGVAREDVVEELDRTLAGGLRY